MCFLKIKRQNPIFSRVFHTKFFDNFLVKSKLSTAKKSKTTTFSRVFHPKEKINILIILPFSKWLKKHNVAIVKLDSAQRINQGTEDVYPSMVAISWHGPDYETALKERTVICREFFDFVAALRKNNWHIPILIGGDFNMDMKSFNLEPNYSDFLYVPYRPVSGSLAKDLKNTFLFTVDSLQVTETAFKQCHPDIYPSPFISVKIRGRTKIKLWAVVRIQRCIRAYLQRAQEKKAGRKKLKDSKKRWKRKIEGDKYVSEPESDNEPEMAKKNSNAAVVGSDPHQVQDEDCTVMVPMANHRRKKYADLKSIYEKREEMRSNEPFIRSLRQDPHPPTVVKPAEKFEF